MSSTELFLLQRCIDREEPCVPEVAGESWFSVTFAAEIMGYELDYFTREINKRKVPRHPLQGKCIRFSDTAKVFVSEQSSEDEERVSNSVSPQRKNKATKPARRKKKSS